MQNLLDSKWTVRILLLFHFIFWSGLALFFDVQADMADHWGWSRHLALSYYEHPPLSAWTVRFLTEIVGNPVLSLKMGAMIYSLLILFLAYQLGCLFYDRKTGTLFVIILETAPYFSFGSLYWHIDKPYMIAWLLGLYVLGKYLITKNHKFIILFGICAGFGALSKYITLVFYISLLLWCLWDKRFRYLFNRWEVYLAAILSLLIFSPVLYWNYQRDWVSFVWQFGRGLTSDIPGKMLPIFTINQMFIYSLIFATWMWIALFKGKLVTKPLGEKESLLIFCGIVPVIFFL